MTLLARKHNTIKKNLYNETFAINVKLCLDNGNRKKKVPQQTGRRKKNFKPEKIVSGGATELIIFLFFYMMCYRFKCSGLLPPFPRANI